MSRVKQEQQDHSARRRRWFAVVALLLPLALLGLIEAGLRIGGYGYDTDFFKVERDAEGQSWLINNDTFMFRFFPPQLARWPGAFRIAADKPPEVQRIFVFGESAAMGDPQPSVGPAHILEVLLRERFPQQKFEVINLGITAINSHVILPVARDVATRGQGDLWIIYMGNNEMVGPFGAATVFGERAAPLPWVRFNLALQGTRLGQLVLSARQPGGGDKTQSAWGGMEMFLQNQVPPADSRRETVYENFDRNLRDTVEAGLNSGAKVALCTMSVNLRDCPPFASARNAALSSADKARFDLHYAAGLRLQTNGAFAEAAANFAEAAQLDSTFAELQFRMAQCLLETGKAREAQEHFQRACNVDALPFRADDRINNSIRSVAQDTRDANLVLCDVDTAVATQSANGIAGDDAFFEHVHFNFDGNFRVARAWADQVAQLLPATSTSAGNTNWLSQADCERAIGLSDWNRRLVISSVMSRLQMPPLSAQFNNATRMQALQQQIVSLGERQPTHALALARRDFAAALQHTPQNVGLLENLSQFCEVTGDFTNALAARREILKRLPHDTDSLVQAGRLLGKLGQLGEAEEKLRQATRQRPTLPGPWFELGVVLFTGAKYREALSCFERVHAQQPADVSTQIYLARTLSKLNRRAEAAHRYREVIARNPDHWQAHLELAEELVVANQAVEAIHEYQTAVQLNPRHPMMRINLGVLLARQNLLNEAIEQFESALKLEPTNAIATDYLRQVQARRGAAGQ